MKRKTKLKILFRNVPGILKNNSVIIVWDVLETLFKLLRGYNVLIFLVLYTHRYRTDRAIKSFTVLGVNRMS